MNTNNFFFLIIYLCLIKLHFLQEIQFKKKLDITWEKCIRKGGSCDQSETDEICCPGLSCLTLNSKYEVGEYFYICWDQNQTTQ